MTTTGVAVGLSVTTAAAEYDLPRGQGSVWSTAALQVEKFHHSRRPVPGVGDVGLLLLCGMMSMPHCFQHSEYKIVRIHSLGMSSVLVEVPDFTPLDLSGSVRHVHGGC